MRFLSRFDEKNSQLRNEYHFDLREHDQKDEDEINKIAKEIEETKHEIFDMKKEGLYD